MSNTLINNATIVNEGKSYKGSLLIKDEKIAATGNIPEREIPRNHKTIDATGLLLLPGVIDCHVHFREPGMTVKGDLFTESIAAAAGGITSFMDMPNTKPSTVTLEALENKYRIASEKSLINYSFYIGATNDNLDEILKADPAKVCGIKLFLGSSTGNMMVDSDQTLRDLFRHARIAIAAHCEDEGIIKANTEQFRQQYGDDITFAMHPDIRSREACLKSSSFAVGLAEEFGTRLHVCHLSTADETNLFSNEIPLKDKRITAEACAHHLWFDDSYYPALGSLIKVNPAIKAKADRDALRAAVNSDKIDIIATDHAPHTAREKSGAYLRSPSGAPMVQHSLPLMMELWHKKIFTIEKIVEKMCHNPAILFNIKERGFIRKGYMADLVLVNPYDVQTVSKGNTLYRCGWSPLESEELKSKVVTTIINGSTVYDCGQINYNSRGQRLIFE
ncbi:MAG: dihydroorotase [Bacteroidales bacterium]|jgi:dihydroorotase|nr:dihydroorotase [Bacteroidales bacterium]